MPDDYDVIGTGTDVVAADGRKVGTVAEVIVDPDGYVTGFVVKKASSSSTTCSSPSPGSLTSATNSIRLKVTAEQAEASPQRATDARQSANNHVRRVTALANDARAVDCAGRGVSVRTRVRNPERIDLLAMVVVVLTVAALS